MRTRAPALALSALVTRIRAVSSCGGRRTVSTSTSRQTRWPSVLSALIASSLLLSSVTVGRRADEAVVGLAADDTGRLASVEHDGVRRRPTQPTAQHTSPEAKPATRSPVRLPANGPRVVDRSVSPVGATGGHGGSIPGVASWFCGPNSRCTRGYPGGLYAAAGPLLRVGQWRGRLVRVTYSGRSVQVRLIDWCACPHRALDLYSDAFQRLAPLSRGVVKVTVSWQ